MQGQPTQEFAKNPNTPNAVQCISCKSVFPIAQVMHEEPLPYPYNTVVEGFIECPSCGKRSHSYYMPEHLRFAQEMLKRAVLAWQRDKTPEAWSEYLRRQKVFQRNFDKTQQKYKLIVEKELSKDER